MGPTLIQIGICKIRLILVGGVIEFVNLDRGPLPEESFNLVISNKPFIVRFLLVLFFSASPMLVPLLIEPSQLVETLPFALIQYLHGVISPLGKAQEILKKIEGFGNRSSFFTILATTGAAYMGVQSLPFLGFSCGNLLMNIGVRLGFGESWVYVSAVTLAIGMMCELIWLLAIGVYIFG